jgi:hypothetical protein
MGTGGTTYYFRVRARDAAGNIEDWPADYDTTTIVDTDAPSGTVVINSGATTTMSTSVTLTLAATDTTTSVSEMAFSNDGTTWSTWQTYATSATWMLTSTDGVKTVRVRFRDAAGNVSVPTTATITLAMSPTVNTFAINGEATITNSTIVSLTISASDANDLGSALGMAFSNDGSSWSEWRSYATSAAWTLSTGDGSKTVSVKCKDVAGNESTVVSASIELDTTAPAGSVAVNSGAVTTTSTSVSLTVNASDTSYGATGLQMAFSNDGTNWSDWQTYATSATWTLSGTDGEKTVYARFRDRAGNVSATATGSIVLDTRFGTSYGLSINLDAIYTNTTSVTLTLSAPAHTTEMQLSNGGLFIGASWEPYASNKQWTLTSYGLYTIPRVVYAKFRTGETVGQTYQDDIVLDVTPPTGSVAIAGASGASAQAANDTVTLTLNATDDVSGVGSMRLGSQSDLSGVEWQGYATSTQWTLAAGGMVYVQYRDNAGNVSEVYSTTLVPPPTPTATPTRPPVYLPIVRRQ